MNDTKPILGLLGATGALGGGLARRWAKAGYEIVIGSRSEEKGQAAADDVLAEIGEGNVRGTSNELAAAAGEIVVLSVPFAHQRSTLEGVRDQLAGKILVDCSVPLVPPKVGRVQLPAEGCAALIAQEVLGSDVDVVSAFQNVGADHLREDHAIQCDVLVTGDSVPARSRVIELVEAAGMKGWHAGPLDNAVAAEALTSILIQINRKYGVQGAGIQITGEVTKEP